MDHNISSPQEKTDNSNTPDHKDAGTEKFYGRRMGRPLRQTSQELVEKLLPTLTFDHTLAQDPHADFDEDAKELWLEIGFGGGEHLCGQARRNPQVNFIGAEAFMNGIVLMLRDLLEDNIENIRLWPEDVRPLLDNLPEGSISRAFLLFPDPWPKARHHKRRFVSEKNLERLARLVKPGGTLRIATDHADYREWIIEKMQANQDFKALFDWGNLPTERPADWVPTRYESKARAQGILCTYMDFERA